MKKNNHTKKYVATPEVNIRIRKEVYVKIKAIAVKKGITLSDVLVGLLTK